MINVILVDDEEDAIETLGLLLTEHCPDIKIIGTASNALEAVKEINEKNPQVVFLDVQMPGYNGFDVLENIGASEVMVVFTTAHKDYAIEALREGAVDYLLKPVDIKELENCLCRIRQKIESRGRLSAPPYFGLIELAVRGQIIFVNPAHIIRLEASRSYTYFFLDNGVKYLVSKSIKEYEVQLDKKVFYRCHNSHVINLKKVVRFHIGDYTAELSDKSMIEVARKNKEEFMEKLRSLQF